MLAERHRPILNAQACTKCSVVSYMACYPINYDSSGDVLSIEFDDHEKDAQYLPHQDMEFPIPYGLTITWKNGRQDKVTKLGIVGVGNARIVLRGIDVASRTLSPCVQVASLAMA